MNVMVISRFQNNYQVQILRCRGGGFSDNFGGHRRKSFNGTYQNDTPYNAGSSHHLLQNSNSDANKELLDSCNWIMTLQGLQLQLMKIIVLITLVSYLSVVN